MNKEFAKDIEACVRALRAGGTILYPTDTVWGLGCDPTNEAAVDKIIHIKDRPKNKSFIVLVDSFDMLRNYVPEADEKIINYLQSVQKPTTVIYSSVKDFASAVYADDDSVAIRVCKDEFCRALIRHFGKPIVSTSANKSGEPAPSLFSEIDPRIPANTDYTVHYRREDARIAAPSTIIKWMNGSIKIIRE